MLVGMSVLVTGGAGYIGSFTVRLLRSLGRDVVVLDTLEFGGKEAVLDAPLVAGDIADTDLVSRLIADHDVTSCIHFAAYKAVGESMEQPGRYFDNNVTGSQRLIDTLHRHGVDQVVFSSSCSVYGTPAHVPVNEAAPLNPESVYAQTKRMIEDVLRWYGVAHGLRSVSLRYFNAAGAAADAAIGEDWTHSQNLIPITMKAILGRRPPLQVFGTDYPTPDGTAIRDYIHVEDLADAHVKALDHLAAGGETLALNVGTGTGTSVQEVIDAAERITGHAVPREYTSRRPGDPVSLYSDNTLVTAELGWKPEQGLDEIVETAWRWHSTHADL
jgi:UDP-glucose-4-epimerase GalE